ncbi:MAG TPA: response regulator [Stellaceae bacterium]|jgi:CheY-like chemotaxis protein/DNA-directed RNA polymerase specialized sigma24 family protein|nr:response regulator [Stellaceae bacterium]
MSISKALAPELPYLRRFARSLTGTQAGGDAYVMETLEAIAADPDIIDRSLPPRVALYRVFLSLWSSVPVNNSVEAAANPLERAGTRNLEALTPMPRIAFLLQSVEGFSREHIAVTLSCSPEEAAELLDVAGKEIADQIATDVLIIEDEPIIGMDLAALVKDLGHRVIDIARTHAEALAAVAEEPPGLVLADLQLADNSSGLNAVNDILSGFEVPVIFITAYPEQLLTGAAPEPAFLITKPFRVETVKAVISQALFFEQNSHLTRHGATH